MHGMHGMECVGWNDGTECMTWNAWEWNAWHGMYGVECHATVVAAADAEIVDIPTENHRFQPGQDSCEAPCEDVLGANGWFGGDFRRKLCDFR